MTWSPLKTAAATPVSFRLVGVDLLAGWYDTEPDAERHVDVTVDVTVDVVGWYSADTQSWGYRYEPDGLRVAKTPPGGTDDVSFTWDRASGLVVPIAEKSPLGGATYWVYGPGGLPVEQIGADGTVVWLHHDQLGSTRAVTDAAGATVATFSWDPYGNPTGRSGSIDVRVGYGGQYTDRETGLVYLRARHYDPTTGQFLTRDPAVAQTREAYGYTGGNPLNMTDPSGMLLREAIGFGTRTAKTVTNHVVREVTGGAANCVMGVTCEEGAKSVAEADPAGTQAVVNFAGGALDLNPMFMIAQAVDEPLTDRDIDLAANGVDECSGWYTAGQWSMAIVDVAIPGHAGWTALNSGRGAGIGNFARVARHQAHRAMPSTFKGGPERVAQWLAEHPDLRTHWHWTWRGVRSGGK